MRLKTMEKIDEGKEKKHTAEPTDNPEDWTPYITYMSDVTRAAHTAVQNDRYLKRRSRVIYKLFQ